MNYIILRELVPFAIKVFIVSFLIQICGIVIWAVGTELFHEFKRTIV